MLHAIVNVSNIQATLAEAESVLLIIILDYFDLLTNDYTSKY